MIVNKTSSSNKKITDATIISKDVCYDESAYGNDGKVIGDTLLTYQPETITINNGLIESDWYTSAYGNGKCVLISSTHVACFDEKEQIWVINPLFKDFAPRGNIVYGNETFVFLDYSNEVYYSKDGINWFQSNIDISASYAPLLGYDQKNQYFVISEQHPSFSSIGSYNCGNHASYDGINWDVPIDSISPFSSWAEEYSMVGILFDDENNFLFIDNWGDIRDIREQYIIERDTEISTTEFLNGYGYNGKGIVRVLDQYFTALGDDWSCDIYVSTDNFHTWTQLEEFSNHLILNFQYYNNKYIGLFKNQLIESAEPFLMSTTDMINWESVNCPNFNYILTNNYGVLGFTNDKAYFSTDLINWEETITIDVYNLIDPIKGITIFTKDCKNRQAIKKENKIKFKDEASIYLTEENIVQNDYSEYPNNTILIQE